MVELSDCFLHRTIAQLQDSLGRCIQAHKGNLVVHCFERVNFELVHLCQCLFQIGRDNHPPVAGISHMAQQNDTINAQIAGGSGFRHRSCRKFGDGDWNLSAGWPIRK